MKIRDKKNSWKINLYQKRLPLFLKAWRTPSKAEVNKWLDWKMLSMTETVRLTKCNWLYTPWVNNFCNYIKKKFEWILLSKWMFEMLHNLQRFCFGFTASRDVVQPILCFVLFVWTLENDKDCSDPIYDTYWGTILLWLTLAQFLF